jgi:hypothetical protein
MRLTKEGTLFVPYSAEPSLVCDPTTMQADTAESGQFKAGKKMIGSWQLAQYLYRGKERIVLDCV